MSKKRVKELVAELSQLVKPNQKVCYSPYHGVYVISESWFNYLEDLVEDFEDAISEPSKKFRANWPDEPSNKKNS